MVKNINDFLSIVSLFLLIILSLSFLFAHSTNYKFKINRIPISKFLNDYLNNTDD